MHYVPESAREFLQQDSSESNSLECRTNFHYESAPVYFLTLLVGLLLLADFVIGLLDIPEWNSWQTLFGLRLALIAAVIGGARILFQTLDQLFEGKVGAGLALTIATLAAIILGENETAALVVLIALIGESIEGFTVDRARSAIRNIFELRPPVAHLLVNGKEEDVPLEKVRIGDRILIRPGERIPVDGTIESGSTSIDQSSLTGESIPVDKTEGEPVYAGTLNQSGSIEITATKVGEETTLSKIVQLVSEATKRKAPLERTADRLARLFLPAVLVFAALTLLYWRWQTGNWEFGFLPMLGVLVVACPCPLILATPTAVMAAMAWLARAGIVVKGSVALERLASIDSIVFDKTGTLTEGKLALGKIFSLYQIDENELLRIAAIAEKRSEHPISRVIVKEAENRGMVIPSVQEMNALPGKGIIAQARHSQIGPVLDQLNLDESKRDPDSLIRIVIGNSRFLEEEKILIEDSFQEEVRSTGQTNLFIAVEGQLIGSIGVMDTIRAEAHFVLRELRSLGIEKMTLLTGDRQEAASEAVSQLPELEEVQAELFPAEKARWIEEEMARNRKVAMIGDGINDAPSLATANVGIALGGIGSELAAEAGDLILMGDPLKPLPSLFKLSRQFVANIKQSIYFFAFGMNLIGILFCASGILSPVAGAVFHEVSSLAVMLNAMRLLWFERWDETWAGRLTHSVNGFSEVITSWLSPSRIIYFFVNRWNMILRMAFGFAVIAWMLSNIVLIRPDEQAVVLRFGKRNRILEPGLYWCQPYPVEEVIKEKVSQLRSLKVGFRKQDDINMLVSGDRPPVEWSSEHKVEDFPDRELETNLLTRDEVSVDLTADVQFRIADLEKYAFHSNQPELILRSLSESSIRSIVLETTLNDLLTDKRNEIEKKCLQLARNKLSEYDTGLAVEEFHFLDVHPPLSVVPSYRDIANALEQKEQLLNESNAYLISRLYEAAGEKMIDPLIPEIMKSGDPDEKPLFSEEHWKKVLSESNSEKIPFSGKVSALLNQAWQNNRKKILEARGNSFQFESLNAVYQLSPSATRFQLYWNSLEKFLSGMKLTLIDSETIDRQNLWMNPFFPASPDKKPSQLQLNNSVPEQETSLPVHEGNEFNPEETETNNNNPAQQ